MLGEATTAEKIAIPGANGFVESFAHEASAIATVTLGFSTDPVARWMYPKTADYFRWFPQFVRAFAGGSIQGGSAFCTENYSGAALWLKPGVHPDDQALTELVLNSLPVERHAELFEFFEKLDRGHPEEPHWYLPMIGVDTFRQNLGIGTSLMREALKQIDTERLSAYLESSNPRNISLYLRLGFEVVGEIRAGSSPPLVQMLRKARH